MPLTCEQLAAREPEPGQLREEIEQVEAINSTFCANRIWYERLRSRMMKLVGDMAQSENPVIISSEAYDLSYQTLYHLLPPCRSRGRMLLGTYKEQDLTDL
jgi:hypothetical protein